MIQFLHYSFISLKQCIIWQICVGLERLKVQVLKDNIFCQHWLDKHPAAVGNVLAYQQYFNTFFFLIKPGVYIDFSTLMCCFIHVTETLKSKSNTVSFHRIITSNTEKRGKRKSAQLFQVHKFNIGKNIYFIYKCTSNSVLFIQINKYHRKNLSLLLGKIQIYYLFKWNSKTPTVFSENLYEFPNHNI